MKNIHEYAYLCCQLLRKSPPKWRGLYPCFLFWLSSTTAWKEGCTDAVVSEDGSIKILVATVTVF